MFKVSIYYGFKGAVITNISYNRGNKSFAFFLIGAKRFYFENHDIAVEFQEIAFKK